MDNTIIQQGRFTSAGVAVDLALRSDVDWLKTYNFTQASTTQATGRGCEFYWQRGMATDVGLMWTKQNNLNAIDLEGLAAGGFTLIDTSIQTPGAVNATGTAVSQANPGVVSAASTAGLTNGDIVRMINVINMQQISGVEFTIAALIANTSFTLAYLDTSGFAAPGTTSSFRRIPNNPQFLPARRVISAITQANPAVITTTIDHGFSVDEVIRIKVPSAFGMTQMDNLQGTITAVTASTITVNIDASAFTAFAWPATATVPITHAQVIPMGTESSTSLSDATDNQSYIGMRLAAGADSPAGSTSDVIYWTAGKSFSVTNI